MRVRPPFGTQHCPAHFPFSLAPAAITFPMLRTARAFEPKGPVWKRAAEGPACELAVGMPVHNGERHLREALDSLLGQTYRDFVLLISDNASTDATPGICREYAARDPRVCYVRQETNAGGAPNFNFVFHRTASPFFKWAASDDLHSPNFLETCVRGLKENPGHFLAFTKYRIIDEAGNDMGDPEAAWPRPHRLASAKAAERWKDSLVDFVGCRHMFGVFRRDALASTPLLQAFWGSDRGMLARLMLRGPMLEAPGALFYSRRDAYCATVRFKDDLAAFSGWFDPRARGRRFQFPRCRLWLMDANSVLTAPISIAEKRRCAAILWRFVAGSPYMRARFASEIRDGLRAWLPWRHGRTRNVEP